MYKTYKAHTTIDASTNAVWNAIIRQNIINDAQHISLGSPSYVDQDLVIGWVTGAKTSIRLPHNEVDANIEAVEIQLEAQGDTTKVTILVAYNPKFDKNFLLAHRSVRGLFGTKLNVLKRNFESDSQHTAWGPAFA